MTLEEEASRVCDTWYLFDHVMQMACFSPLEELAEHVLKPEKFRENIKQTVICMSDQMPFYIKLQPGKQLYSKEEVQETKKKAKTDH